MRSLPVLCPLWTGMLKRGRAALAAGPLPDDRVRRHQFPAVGMLGKVVLKSH